MHNGTTGGTQWTPLDSGPIYRGPMVALPSAPTGTVLLTTLVVGLLETRFS